MVDGRDAKCFGAIEFELHAIASSLGVDGIVALEYDTLAGLAADGFEQRTLFISYRLPYAFDRQK